MINLSKVNKTLFFMGYLALTSLMILAFNLSDSGVVAFVAYALLAPMVAALLFKYLSECMYSGAGYSFRDVLQRIVLSPL